MEPLPIEFYSRNTVDVAVDLLGKTIVHSTKDGVKSARIVETEAYLGKYDEASHGFRRTKRSEIMWGKPGISYVFVNYGIHHCFNTVTCPEGEAGAVLVRAVEPVLGIGASTNGPGKLTRELGITKRHNEVDLTSGDLVLTDGIKPKVILAGKRIGILRSADLPLRFFIKDNPHISGTKTWNSQAKGLDLPALKSLLTDSGFTKL